MSSLGTEIDTMVEKLSAADEASWSTFLFNVAVAKKLIHIEKSTAASILQAGIGWKQWWLDHGQRIQEVVGDSQGAPRGGVLS